MKRNQPPEGQEVPIHVLSVQLEAQSSFGRVSIGVTSFKNVTDFLSTSLPVLQILLAYRGLL